VSSILESPWVASRIASHSLTLTHIPSSDLREFCRVVSPGRRCTWHQLLHQLPDKLKGLIDMFVEPDAAKVFVHVVCVRERGRASSESARAHMPPSSLPPPNSSADWCGRACCLFLSDEAASAV